MPAEVQTEVPSPPDPSRHRPLGDDLACDLLIDAQTGDPLARDTSESGQRRAGLLGRLSGRQSKRGRKVSASMILAGLDKLLVVLALLQETTLEELRGLRTRPPRHRVELCCYRCLSGAGG